MTAAWLFCIGCALLGLCVGKYPLSLEQVVAVFWQSLTGHSLMPLADAAHIVVWEVRVPRVLAALMVGAALAAAGGTYQGMFRNPLVSPDILGVSAGAGLGAVLGIFIGGSLLLVQGLAFVGGVLAVALVWLAASVVRRHDPVLVLVLAGIAVGTLLGAGIALLKVLADPYTQLSAITFWLLGGLNAVTLTDLKSAAPVMLLGLVPMALLRWRVNLLSLSDDEALALGVHVQRLRLILVVAATLMTAAAVSITGIIGWVGLVVPHAARLLVGPEFGRLLPIAMLLGAGFVVLADTLARSTVGMELPLGVVTALVGAPVFLWLLARKGRSSHD
ncbi:FecCD family ABC transporter permease [Lampropedia aestuarii]|uniref:FecCD family ABC transporter permease n=1 Tax=Lampropedia aestuarii TaxID=2562762 RepID=UPI0024687947|nr:iron ABC transporter permease [Lampropedia aestuarii]MDH5856386.1 iron ABC transporter permease [Lampropedia aestuarii]